MVPHLGGHPQTLSLDLQLNRILTANSSNERVRSRLNGYIFGWVHIPIISLISVPTFLSQFYRKYVVIIIIFRFVFYSVETHWRTVQKRNQD